MASIAGLKLITPTSVTAITGSASIGSNGTVTFTGIEKLQVNGVFSSTYDNYLVVASNLISPASGSSLFIALRSGGTTASSNYNSQRMVADGTSTIAVRFTGGSVVYAADMGTSSVANGGHTYIYGPYLTQPTAFRTVSVQDISGAKLSDYAGTHTTSASYDSIEFGDNSVGVTQSGKIQIFGLSQ